MSASQPHPNNMPLGPVILDLPGPRLQPGDREMLRHPLVGGVIFFDKNFQSREQLLDLVAAIRQVRSNLVLAVDQEGGRVQRFKTGFTRLPPMQSFWCVNGGGGDSARVLARDCGWLMAAEILACDIDISFAPVLDVDDVHCQVIADRSFAPDPKAASRLAGAFIAGMREAGMACTGKHFPGHGGVAADSHLDLPIDRRDFSQLQARDLIPFVELAAQLDAIMPAHLLFPNIDPQAVGFSSYWLQNILRRQLGFSGVIFSDDLSMAGAAAAGTYPDRAERALEAGCDAILVCHNRVGAEEILERLERRHVEADDRLAKMRRRRVHNWSDLQNDSRRDEIRSQLATLVQSSSA